jgi:hypothetical protein
MSCWAQDPTPQDPSQSEAASPDAAGASKADTNESQRQKAEQQVKTEEQQRVLGIFPHFNVWDLNDAVRLSPKQKLELAFKTSVDPVTIAVAGATAGISQAQNSTPGFGQGALGYGKRFAASYLDTFNGTMIGNGLLPALLHQDPRYLRKRSGSIPTRIGYAMLSTFRCKGDNGNWQFNYSNVLGNLASGGISNLYYPQGDRGFVPTYQRAIVVSIQGALGATFDEFWPDISRHLRKHQSGDQH